MKSILLLVIFAGVWHFSLQCDLCKAHNCAPDREWRLSNDCIDDCLSYRARCSEPQDYGCFCKQTGGDDNQGYCRDPNDKNKCVYRTLYPFPT